MKTLKIRGDISFYSGVLEVEALASYRFSKFELTVPSPQTAQWTVVNCRFLELFLGHPYVAKTS